MIKRYNDFIQESFSQENHHSLGEYIEQLAENDEFIQMIVGQMTGDIDVSIRMSNAINLLDDLQKVELLKRVENHLNGVEGETNVSTTVDAETVSPTEPIDESYGKSVLNTFFKCLTALGFKDNTPQTEQIPSEFLIIFKLTGVESSKIEGVFNRFKSLQSIKVDYSHPTMGLYFGIKCDGLFEYGYYYDELVPIGQFKLTKSVYNQIKLSELKSASGLKKILVNLNFEDVVLMSKIKVEMDKFNPGYFEQKMVPQINDRTMTFGFYGVGKWDNGQLDSGEFENVKSNLKMFLSKYKWSEKIMISVQPSKFWVYIQIKMK
jgi:hypothetical protein